MAGRVVEQYIKNEDISPTTVSTTRGGSHWYPAEIPSSANQKQYPSKTSFRQRRLVRALARRRPPGRTNISICGLVYDIVDIKLLRTHHFYYIRVTSLLTIINL